MAKDASEVWSENLDTTTITDHGVLYCSFKWDNRIENC